MREVEPSKSSWLPRSTFDSGCGGFFLRQKSDQKGWNLLLSRLTDRELTLLGQPTRAQVAHLVGWMALANAFGDVSADPICSGERLSHTEMRWIKGIARKAGVSTLREHKGVDRQQISGNRKRKVTARRSRMGLVT